MVVGEIFTKRNCSENSKWSRKLLRALLANPRPWSCAECRSQLSIAWCHFRLCVVDDTVDFLVETIQLQILLI